MVHTGAVILPNSDRSRNRSRKEMTNEEEKERKEMDDSAVTDLETSVS